MRYEELVAQLNTDDKRARVALIEKLRDLLPDSVDAALAGMRDPRPLAGAACAAILDHADHDDRIEEALRQATRDPDARARKSALHSLSCAHCKPDGCVVDDSVDYLVGALLNDSSIRVRRTMAGIMMFGQAGRGPAVTSEFERVLANDSDKVLRERAAIYLAAV